MFLSPLNLTVLHKLGQPPPDAILRNLMQEIVCAFNGKIGPMNTHPRIALVEDDEDLRLNVEDFLSDAGYPVWGVHSAEAFYRKFTSDPVDIVILDLGLPGEDGLSVVELLRNNPKVAVIIVSARDSSEDRLIGLSAGADRYLVKPVSLNELLVNIEAVQRRLNPAAQLAVSSPPENNPPIQTKPTTEIWRLDPREWCLSTPDGQVLPLTSREYQLLKMLVNQPGVVVGKKDITTILFGTRVLNANERLNVLMARLRKKSREQLGMDLPIKTAHQNGYVFTGDVR